MREQAEQAELDYMRGMKYKDIAEKYGVSINTVKSWKQRYGWERNGRTKKPKSKTERCKKRKRKYASKEAHKKTAESEEEKRERKKIFVAAIENGDLNDKQRLFCIFYLSSHNALISYKRAYKCSYQTAASAAYRLLENVRIKSFINEMKDDRDRNLLLRATDVVDMYMRIAFADMNQIALIKDGNVVVADSEDIDGQIVQEIKPTPAGVSIKLADRMKALEWLSNYFELNPKDRHKAQYNDKILELKERRVKADEF